MTKKEEKRGGNRPGAGRPKGAKYKKFTFNLLIENVKKLEEIKKETSISSFLNKKIKEF